MESASVKAEVKPPPPLAIPKGVLFTEEFAAIVATLPADDSNTLSIATKACSGDPKAQCQLGNMFSNGYGVKQDAAKAFEWLSRSASQGNADAQCFMGLAYQKGTGVEKNAANSFRCFQKPAADGHARSQTFLGLCYLLGKGTQPNPTNAVLWLAKAAEQEDSLAQLYLSSCYAKGLVVSQDLWRAHELLLAASEKQDSDDSKIALTALSQTLVAYAATMFAVKDDPRFSDNDTLRLVANSVATYRLKYPTYDECQMLQTKCCELFKENLPHDVLAAVQGCWYAFAHDISMFRQGLCRYGGQWVNKEQLNQLRSAQNQRVQEMFRHQADKLAREAEDTADNERYAARSKGRQHTAGSAYRSGESYWSSSPQLESEYRSAMRQAFGSSGGSSGFGEYSKIMGY
jgi:TPR repeat protein